MFYQKMKQGPGLRDADTIRNHYIIAVSPGGESEESPLPSTSALSSLRILQNSPMEYFTSRSIFLIPGGIRQA